MSSAPSSAPRFAILASGRGSNAEALMDAFERGEIGEAASIGLVLSNKPDAEVLTRARRRGYPVEMIPSHLEANHEQLLPISRASHEAAVLACLRAHRIDHLLLAGYLRILSPQFLSAFTGPILNIHPSLLPDFAGLYAVERQWQAGVKISGATVHFVDAGVDTGPILVQERIHVRGDEGVEGLRQRILREVEHIIYPRAVRLLLKMQLKKA